jgi:hypothetical protein
MNVVKYNPMIEYEITDSPVTSREPDRGHGTYSLHSEHTRHTKLLEPKRPTAMSTMSITSCKQASKQARKKARTWFGTATMINC